MYSYNTYIMILLLNNGQSNVKVSYSPPSPHTLTPYFSFYNYKYSLILNLYI